MNAKTLLTVILALTSQLAAAQNVADCVHRPVLGRDPVCNQGRSAAVTNLCSQKVDVKLCMENNGRWDCRVEWGVAPGRKWSASWCNGNGNTWYAVRPTGSDRRFDNP